MPRYSYEKKIGFRPKIRKRIQNLKKALHELVELVETNPLMYNMKDLG